ncbi:3-phosphoshikimate 1-carboxyvinyltransferase [Deminuibacter soli]|uniref:3-phosphoshikimate 1-carboxyvinyltransferase n=1 Tax=Deminuibacter soli TaxID=2291815 RepID=A0A3E1NLT4_9BACT|nr:3-phosphoshikimate 1-carboxyvinyltransferase [Deminuibacter soli]RFM28758.1 3-phosphoshikimate 1-carboxyvinyltransferase [Deminuibacter soli]
MQVEITPSGIQGEIYAPASKSSMQRACAAALVRKGTSVVLNPGHSNDDLAALRVIQAMGALVQQKGDDILVINSNGIAAAADEVNCGESGLGIRMFSPLIALNTKNIRINGEGSLTTRPMDFFDDTLPKLGVTIQSNNGKLPLNIKGPLQPKNIAIDGSLSSQFLTGLLMAYAAADATDVTIVVHNLKSKPYIDLTLKVMSDFGLKVPENKNYEAFYFGKDSVAIEETAETLEYTVEGDWSGGAFLLVAGAIAGPIRIKGLDVFSTQADKAILQALMDCGCVISVQSDVIEIGPGKLKAFQFDANDCPDLFPPLVALASYCEGTTVIEGVERLTHKESNRALTLQDEFGKMGIVIELQDNLMIVKGGTGVQGAAVHSRHDHRIAMACAVAALRAEGNTHIGEAQAINKSYPDFYTHLQKLGATVSINNKSAVHE